jgi:hypothetical protein
MNIPLLCVAGPVVVVGAYGLTSLLWTAIGIGLPKPRRRAFAHLKECDKPKNADHATIDKYMRGRVARMPHFATLPREGSHGIGTHFDN